MIGNKITIGIPVFNESKTIGSTVLSCVDQCDCLIISDNCSTDDTLKTCNELAEKYDNIKVFSHRKNQGSTYNFKFLLEKCETEYFMFLGAHDRIPNGYVDVLLELLKNNEGSSLAFSPCHLEDIHTGKTVRIRRSDAVANNLMSEYLSHRVAVIMKKLQDWFMIYGVWRTEILKQCYPDHTNICCVGGDGLVLLDAAIMGKILYSEQTYFIAGYLGEDHNQEYIKRIKGERELKIDLNLEQCARLFNYRLMLAYKKGLITWWEKLKFSCDIVYYYNPYSDNFIIYKIQRVFYKQIKMLWRNLYRVFLYTKNIKI